MTLYVGYFFEGTYQLEKELTGESGSTPVRWLVDDFTGNQKERAVIEMYPYRFDDKLAWKGEIKGLKKIGQSATVGYRYFVWEVEGESIAPVVVDEVDDETKRDYIRLIDSLSILPNEVILTLDSPEYWRSAAGEVLIFYRKQATQHADFEAQKRIKEFWKEILGAASLPTNTTPEVVLPEFTPPRTPPEKPIPVSVATRVNAVRVALIGIGIILAVVAYFLKPPYSEDDSKARNVSMAVFTKAIENGTIHAQKGEYNQAIEYFTAAVNTPESDVSKARMDSLSKVYKAMAIAECKRYQTTQSPELYFIPDQYYHYAYLLDGTTSRKRCE